MTSFIHIALAVAAFVLLPLSTPASAQSVELFAQAPVISSPRLSPDGRYVATIQPYNDKPAVSIYDRSAPTEPPVIFPSSDWLIDDIMWAKNDRLIIFLKSGQEAWQDSMLRTWGRAIAISPRGDDLVTLFEGHKSLGYNVALRVEDVALDDPDNIYMPLQVLRDRSDEFVGELYRVNVRDGSTKKVARGVTGTFRWIMDGQDQVIARIDETINPLTHHVLVREGDDWREIAAYPAGADLGAGIYGLTEDGSAFVQGLLVDGRRALSKTPLDGSGGPAIVYRNGVYDTNGVLYDEWTNRVIGALSIADRPVSTYFDPARQHLQKGLQTAFPA